MKTMRLMLLLLVGMALSVQAAEKDLRPRFERVREMEKAFGVGQQGRIVVPGDLFGQARHFPNDVRLIGADGTQWPYFLYVPREAPATGTLSPEILNRSFVEGAEPYLQFDLIIPPAGGKAPVHNRLELITAGRDFVRRVEVFGRDHGRMASGYLIDFSRQRDARNRTIHYPDSDADRLQVRIYPNAQNAGETVDLVAASLHYRTVAEVEREAVDAAELPVPEREETAGAQTWLLDLGQENRPVEWMHFNVATPSYARSVCIYGRNPEHDPWAWAGGGEIHALEGDEQTQLRFSARHRFLKVQLFHYDDQPLAVNSIQLEAVPRYLVFEAAGAGQASLYYRGWDVESPRYDLNGRVETSDIPKLPLCHLGESAPNAAAKAQPWRAYSTGLAILAVAAVSLLVVGIIVSMLKQQKKDLP
jgi:hypothetical protein